MTIIGELVNRTIGELVNRTIGELVNRLKFNRFKRVAV